MNPGGGQKGLPRARAYVIAETIAAGLWGPVGYALCTGGGCHWPVSTSRFGA